jgi:hypothetical protein
MGTGDESGAFDSKKRQALFLEMAAKGSGVTAQVVYERGKAEGDTVTEEAYHNAARRLAHRGLLVADKSARQTVYRAGANVDEQWLDEEELASIIDPEYPLIALTAMRESYRQLNEIPEQVWLEARELLKNQNAQDLFFEAIVGYADNLKDEFERYLIDGGNDNPKAPSLRREVEANIMLLRQLAKFGLGLSKEAIQIPQAFEIGLEAVKKDPTICFYDQAKLREEIARRVSPEKFIVEDSFSKPDASLLVAGVDGSTRGGLLSLEGEAGDFFTGHAPAISINTSIAQIDRHIKTTSGSYPAFFRLPEKPEDMQQRDNRYTIMAKLFFPDLTDSQYAHSVWNAMDLLEARAALQVMSRWSPPKHDVEVTPADVVLRDGTVIPNDRDSNHYVAQDSYGRIVRDLIETNWQIIQKCRDDGQTVAGVVKNAQMKVMGPVINHFLARHSAHPAKTQISPWPLRAMNSLHDQNILSKILSVGRKKGDEWIRTCMVLRPFHAATDFADDYNRTPGDSPADRMLRRHDESKARIEEGQIAARDVFWQSFRRDKDFYVQMLKNVWYAGFYLGALPRLDRKEMLPRMEFIVPRSTREEGEFPTDDITPYFNRLMSALRKQGFEVSNEHDMFGNAGKIDIQPSLLIAAHDTVKIWATELLSRVQEYVGYHLSRYLKRGGAGKVRIRQWKRVELEAWVQQMKDERNRQAGTLSSSAQLSEDEEQ